MNKFSVPAKLLFIFVILFAFFWSFHKTDIPRYWYDEAVNIQIARNAADLGNLNIQVSPAEGYPRPYQIMTSGYPLALPLAILFKIFGFSFELARGYMLGWFIFFILLTYYFCSRRFGPWLGLASSLLVLTFPPAIFHGLSVVGELPGLSMLLLSAILLDKFEDSKKESNLYFGLLFLGLSVAAKPLFVIFIPAFLIALYFSNIRPTIRQYFIGAIFVSLPIIVFAFTVLPPPYIANIRDLVSTYNGRANQHGLSTNIFHNLGRFFHDKIMIYIGLLAIICLGGIKWTQLRLTRPRIAQLFLSLSCVFAFLFFLQSVGWNRYLLPVELILLIYLPAMCMRLSRFIPRIIIIAGLVLLPIAHVTYGVCCSELANFSGNWEKEVENIVDTYMKEGTVYALGSDEAAALVEPNRLYRYFRFENREYVPNMLKELDQYQFDHLIFKYNNQDVLPYLDKIKADYVLDKDLGGLTFWSRK